MIALETFAKTIQTGLNAVAANSGVTYAIHSDGSSFKEALITRTGKTLYTNGILIAGESSITPAQGLVIAAQSVSLQIVVQLFDKNTDDAVIAQHREILDSYFKNFGVQAISDGANTYSVGAVYSLAGTGTVEIRDGIGTSITFFVDIQYSYIQNGLNSYNCIFTLDGEVIPYTSATITKTPETQSAPYISDGGVGECYNVAFNRTFEFQMPAHTGDAIGQKIIGYLLGNNLNETMQLTVNLGGTEATFDVTLGETDITLEGVSGAGHKFSLIEVQNGGA